LKYDCQCLYMKGPCSYECRYKRGKKKRGSFTKLFGTTECVKLCNRYVTRTDVVITEFNCICWVQRYTC
jgi:hypothetical protein